MAYVLLVIGFILLAKGAEFAVSGGGGLAEHFRISPVIIGLTVIAFGTSAPELAVTVTGAFVGQSGIAVGNVIGSNIINLLLVGGLAAAVKPMVVHKTLIRRDFLFSLLAAFFIVVLAARPFFGGKDTFVINRFSGFLLLAVFTLFMILLLMEAKKERETSYAQEGIEERSLFLNIVYTVGGLAGIVFGAELVVDSATGIARAFDLSETFIGLTVVSFGTSLPELVTSVVAAKRGNSEIAMGNIIGSNIFNILFVLGIAATLVPVTVPSYLLIDSVILCAVTLMAMGICWRNRCIASPGGYLFLAIYAIYFVYIFFRG
ncbi:MAG TPA: calcium/sodium antiporter [Clostridiales bacterium]|nr:calcium/sodium antiporter [Clostridiales bacterium]